MARARTTPPADPPAAPAPTEPWTPPDEPIHVLLARILGELPAIGKTDYNEQQRFHFRGHDAVLNALNPLLAEYGIVPVPTVLERIATTRQTRGGSAMYEVNLHVQYRLYGPRGDHVEASAWGEGTDMGDKSTNKAMTMAFKNILAQVFAVSTADTIDSDATSPEETVHPAAAPPAPAPPPAPPRTATEAFGRLGSWCESGEPWVREAVEKVAAKAEAELPADWTWKSLPEDDRVETTKRLWTVIDKLAAADLDPQEDADGTRTTMRTAFTEAFGVDVEGPDPFAPPIPF